MTEEEISKQWQLQVNHSAWQMTSLLSEINRMGLYISSNAELNERLTKATLRPEKFSRVDCFSLFRDVIAPLFSLANSPNRFFYTLYPISDRVFCDYEIAEGAVSDHAVVDPADADAAGVAGDIAVGHRNVPAAVDVDAVVVGEQHGSLDLRPVEMHVLAAAYPVGPAGGLVAHGHILHQHVLTADQEHHPSRAQAAHFALGGMQAPGTVILKPRRL